MRCSRSSCSSPSLQQERSRQVNSRKDLISSSFSEITRYLWGMEKNQQCFFSFFKNITKKMNKKKKRLPKRKQKDKNKKLPFVPHSQHFIRTKYYVITRLITMWALVELFSLVNTLKVFLYDSGIKTLNK